MQAEEKAPLLTAGEERVVASASASTVDGTSTSSSDSKEPEHSMSSIKEEGPDGPRAPKVQTLTADDPGMLAREQAYREERIDGLGIGSLARTLAQEDPTVAARHAAYQARKNEKKKKRSADPLSHLSNLPETEDDVNYRFNFIVRGARSEEVTEAVCHGANRSSSSSPCRGDQGYRCICRVSSPMDGLLDADKDKPKLAKLIFRPIGHWEDVPVCTNRAEALSTVVVTAFDVEGAEGSLEEQLKSFNASVQNIRARSRPKRRPVRAVLLICGVGSNSGWQYGSEDSGRHPSESAESPMAAENASSYSGLDGWAAKFADFESEHGDLWKFGPFHLQDKEALHGAFSEMASVRIAQNGLGQEGAKVDEEEPEENELALDEAEEKAALFASEGKDTNDGNDAKAGGGSSNASACSEGWHRPPVFDTEVDGSECSENALELHGKIFGMEEAALLEARGIRNAKQDEAEDENPADDCPESVDKEQRWDLGCCCISRRSDHQSPRTVTRPPPHSPPDQPAVA